MHLPHLSFQTPQKPGLLLAYQLSQIAARMDANPTDKQDEGPKKPLPEIPAPAPGKNEPSPDVVPEMPGLPKTPETQKPSTGPEVKPSPDVVEIPDMPQQPEVGVPQRDLPGGILH